MPPCPVCFVFAHPNNQKPVHKINVFCYLSYLYIYIDIYKYPSILDGGNPIDRGSCQVRVRWVIKSQNQQSTRHIMLSDHTKGHLHFRWPTIPLKTDMSCPFCKTPSTRKITPPNVQVCWKFTNMSQRTVAPTRCPCTISWSMQTDGILLEEGKGKTNGLWRWHSMLTIQTILVAHPSPMSVPIWTFKSGIDKNNKILNFSFTFFILKLLSILSLTDNYSCVSLPSSSSFLFEFSLNPRKVVLPGWFGFSICRKCVCVNISPHPFAKYTSLRPFHLPSRE